MLRDARAMLKALLGTDEDNRVHVDSEDRPAAARKLADALEKIMRDGSDAAPGADLCPGCVLFTLADAAKLLLERYAPETQRLNLDRRGLIDALEGIANRPSKMR